jgi:hypothetical protein
VSGNQAPFISRNVGRRSRPCVSEMLHFGAHNGKMLGRAERSCRTDVARNTSDMLDLNIALEPLCTVQIYHLSSFAYSGSLANLIRPRTGQTVRSSNIQDKLNCNRHRMLLQE